MWHCRSCDLYQKGHLPPVHVYDRTYHATYEPHRNRKLRTAYVRLNRVWRLLPPDCHRPKMLDVGCSLGTTIEAGNGLGWDACGVDVSTDAIDDCRHRGLRCATSGGVELPYPDETFDVLTAWHVIEHVGDVARTLTEWRRVVKPGGLLVMEMPDTSCLKVRVLGKRYTRYWSGEHVYAFQRANFEPFVRRADLEILAYPWWGRMRDLPGPLAAYSVAYQAAKGAQRLAGVSKAFQVFCRRPIEANRPGQRQHAA